MEQVSGGGTAHRSCECGGEGGPGEHVVGECGSAGLPAAVWEAKEFTESQN